jgi:lipopolysaccharide assembly protein A
MRLVKGLVALPLFFAVLFFGIQFARDNHQALSLKLPGGWETLDIELWALVLVSAAVGAVLATVVFIGQLIGNGLAKHRLTRRIKSLERELNDLRNMPLSAERAPDKPAASPPESGSAPEAAADAGGSPPA